MYSNANIHLFGNRTLQGLAQGYCSDAMLVGQYIAPVVQVECRTGNIVRFGKEAFAVQDTRRAYSAKVQTVSSKFSADTYTLESHALAYTIPVEILESSGCLTCANQTSIDLRQIELNNITARLNRGHEFEVIKMVTNPATYEATNYGLTVPALLPTSLNWKAAGSTPIKDVLAVQSLIRKNVGCRPNAIVLGSATYELLMAHPDIVSRIQYTTVESVTTDTLARYFNVASVIVADGLYTDATGALSSMFPEYGFLLFYSPAPGQKAVALTTNSAYNLATPSSFYTYMMKGGITTSDEQYYDITSCGAFANVVRAAVSMEYSVQAVSLGDTNKVNSAVFINDVTA
jgi:sarcosine oxidase delta subunit